MKKIHHAYERRRGFSVIELLVAAGVFMTLLVVMVNITGHITKVSKNASERINAFQNARVAYDLMVQSLSLATLNSYWDYDNPTSPSHYLRNSELHFVVGEAGQGIPGTIGTGQAIFFQAPMGMTREQNHFGGLEGLLSSIGFYISYADSEALPSPFTMSPTYRYRLMQALQSTEDLSVYQSTGSQWISTLTAEEVPIADNVILLAIWPRRALREDPVGNRLTNDFNYDSRNNALLIPQPETAHQLPPLVQVVMVAIDERSAERLCTSATPPAAIQSALEGLSGVSTEAAFEADLATFEEALKSAGIDYRIFSSIIPLRESKME